jgi:hypothetical protein
VIESCRANRSALVVIRPVTIDTETPRRIAARIAAVVRSPRTRSSPTSVPSRSSAIRPIGNVGAGRGGSRSMAVAAGSGAAGSPTSVALTGEPA